MRLAAVLLLLVVMTACGPAPTVEQLTGRWESPDKRYLLHLQPDGTFTNSAKSYSSADPDTGINFIAPYGNWSLKGNRMMISGSVDGMYDPHMQIRLKIVRLTRRELAAQFGEGSPPMRFTRLE